MILKFESESSIKFRINVFAIDEYANFSEFASLSNYSLKKEYFHSNVKRRVIVDEKSKYSLFRKISKLFEDRINIITKLSPARMLTKPQILQIFCVNIQLKFSGGFKIIMICLRKSAFIVNAFQNSINLKIIFTLLFTKFLI